MNLEHIFELSDPLKQDTPLVNLLKETINRMPSASASLLRDFFRRVGLHFNDDVGGVFERKSGRLYIRPSRFYDITCNNLFNIDKALKASQISLLGKGVSLRDNSLNGYGLLLALKGGGVSIEGIHNALEEYAETDAELRTFVRRYCASIEGKTEEQSAFKCFREVLGDHLNEIANNIKEESGGKEVSDCAIYYDLMSSGFAEYLIPTDETFEKIEYSKKSFFPSLSESYVHDFINATVNFTDCANKLYGDLETTRPFNDTFGSYCFSILKKERRATPLVLATLRYKGWITPDQYTVAIADIKHYYELRPAGDIKGDSILY